MIDIQEQIYEHSAKLLGMPKAEVKRLWECYGRILKRQIRDNYPEVSSFPVLGMGKIRYSKYGENEFNLFNKFKKNGSKEH